MDNTCKIQPFIFENEFAKQKPKSVIDSVLYIQTS